MSMWQSCNVYTLVTNGYYEWHVSKNKSLSKRSQYYISVLVGIILHLGKPLIHFVTQSKMRRVTGYYSLKMWSYLQQLAQQTMGKELVGSVQRSHNLQNSILHAHGKGKKKKKKKKDCLWFMGGGMCLFISWPCAVASQLLSILLSYANQPLAVT